MGKNRFNPKKLNLLEQNHADKMVQLFMDYGMKNKILPGQMLKIFEKTLERWKEVMPDPKKKKEGDDASS